MTEPSPDQAFHRTALVWDNHACLPMNPARNLDFLPQINRYARAGCDMVSLNIGYGEISREDHVSLARQMTTWIADHPETCRLVSAPADITRAKDDGVLGVAFDIEGAGAIAQLEDVQAFYDLGVRWMLLAYNRNNAYAGGCHDDDQGLTPAGRELIDEMQRVGMVVCCSHVGYRTLDDVLTHATKPVILSHSNPRALWDHPRNVPDALLKGVAASGGVVGVNGLKLFLGEEQTPARVCDHALYLLEVLGEDAVGFGLDYVFDLDEIDAEKKSMDQTFPPGWGYEEPVWCFDIDHWPSITRALLDRGAPHPAAEKLLGQNWLRVAEACWT